MTASMASRYSLYSKNCRFSQASSTSPFNSLIISSRVSKVAGAKKANSSDLRHILPKFAVVAEVEKLRVDKYLWAIRVFKTRSLATEACKAGRVKLEGRSVKPSALVKVGDSYHIQTGLEKKVLRATGLLGKRVDAKTAGAFYEIGRASCRERVGQYV